MRKFKYLFRRGFRNINSVKNTHQSSKIHVKIVSDSSGQQSVQPVKRIIRLCIKLLFETKIPFDKLKALFSQFQIIHNTKT